MIVLLLSIYDSIVFDHYFVNLLGCGAMSLALFSVKNLHHRNGTLALI